MYSVLQLSGYLVYTLQCYTDVPEPVSEVFKLHISIRRVTVTATTRGLFVSGLFSSSQRKEHETVALNRDAVVQGTKFRNKHTNTLQPNSRDFCEMDIPYKHMIVDL